MASSAKRRSKGSKASDSKRKRKYSGSDEDGPAYLSCKYSEPPTSKIYNNRFKHSTPDQLFRADLISAMKMADSEPLSPDEYLVIGESWRTEWERGVQVPVNPESLPEPTFRILRKRNKNAHYKLPKKLIRLTRDSTFDPEIHSMSYANTFAEKTCRYDMDNLDFHWLTIVNTDREDFGLSPLQDIFIEKVIEELELQAYVNFQEAIKSEEGLGIEYDEDAICDVCRSPDSHEGNEMVFCDSCNICVHQICYGITKIPEGSWICRTCALGIRPACVLCPNRGGAMKTIRCGQKWAHVGCAVWIPEVSFFNFVKMEPIVKISHIPSSRWSLVCSLCNNKCGACIQCSDKSCKVAFHVTCAFNEGLQMRASVKNNDSDEDTLKAFCKKHGHKRAMFSDSEEDDLSNKRDSLSSEERANKRQKKILEKEAEFYNYVNVEEIAEQFEVDLTDIITIFNYWKLKRKANFNRPLLTPKVNVPENPIEEENSPLHFLKKLVFHRRDLERARNLCYMVKNREKLVKNWIQAKEAIFNKQVSILTKKGKQLTDCQTSAVISANYGDLAYDKKYSGNNGPSPNMVSVLTNLVGEDVIKTKPNGVVKSTKKSESRNSGKTPNPYAKHYLNGLFMRTQRSISTVNNKQKKVQFQRDTTVKKDTNLADNLHNDSLQNSSDSLLSSVEQPSKSIVSESNNSFDSSAFNCNIEFLSNKEGDQSESLPSVINIKEEGIEDMEKISASEVKVNCTDTVELIDCNFEKESCESIAEIAIENLKIENSCDNVKIEEDITTNTVKTEEIIEENAEYMYIPELDVGANVKMDQTYCIDELKEIYDPHSVYIEPYDIIYDPCTVEPDKNILLEECIYESCKPECDIKLNNEADIVNNYYNAHCDTEKLIEDSEASNSELVCNSNNLKTTCNEIELNNETVSQFKEEKLHYDIDINAIGSDKIETDISLTDSSSRNKLSGKESKGTIRKSDENHSINEQKKYKPSEKKLSSKTTVIIKNNINKKSKTKLKRNPCVQQNIVTKIQPQGNEMTEIKLCHKECTDDKQFDLPISINNKVDESNLDAIENNLKLEVKKNNNRMMPLPYVVLNSEDVVKCMKVSDSVKYVKNQSIISSSEVYDTNSSDLSSLKTSKMLHNNTNSEFIHEKNSESQHGKISDSLTKNTSESQTFKTSESQHDKISESLHDKISESKYDKILESLHGKTTESLTSKTSESRTCKTSESLTNKTSEYLHGNTLESLHSKTSGSVLGKTSENLDGKSSENLHDKSSENLLGMKSSESPHGKSSESLHTKPSDILLSKPSDALHSNKTSDILSKPSNNLLSKPSDTLQSEPSDTLHSKPSDTLHIKLSDTLPGKFVDSLHNESSATPLETLHCKSADTLLDTPHSKPSETPQSKPSDIRLSKTSEISHDKNFELKDHSDKELINKKSSKINGLTKKSISPDPITIKKSKSNDKVHNKSSPSRTNSPTHVKVFENSINKSNKSIKKRFNPDSSPVLSKQLLIKSKHSSNLSSSTSASKPLLSLSSPSKCQEKAKPSERSEHSLSEFRDSTSFADKPMQPPPRRDTFRGYKIPKKPQSSKPVENSLDLRRGNTPLSPLPDISSTGTSGYHNKATWRKLEPRSSENTHTSFIKNPPPRNCDNYPLDNQSERLVLTLRKDTTDPESRRWKADNSFNRNNCRRNWNHGQTPPLMPPPSPFPHLLQPGHWPLMANQVPVNFRPIHSNYPHGPFT